MSPEMKRIGGVLLLYRRPITKHFADAKTIDDHIAAFAKHSKYAIHSHNTDLGFPRGLRGVSFDAVVLHYSLFGHGGSEYPFPPQFNRWLDQSPDTYKIAFFHDEHTFCGRRFAYLNDRKIDCVFTMLQPSEFAKVYGKYTPGVSKIVSHLPGYVSDDMLEIADRLTIPDADRPIDVGFRARPLEPFMGRDEKTMIGRGFAERSAGTDLVTDIEISPESLLPGESWFEFLARCKTVLGVESGTTCFDLEDEVWEEYERLKKQGRDVTAEDLRKGELARWHDSVYYKTIGPRHFEAAAMRVTQVLFEGSYSGLMEPMVHYVPLKADFSNFDEVVAHIGDANLRVELADNAHRDLIASGEHTFSTLIAAFDAVLAAAGLAVGESDAVAGETALHRAPPVVALQNLRSNLSYHPFWSKALWRVSRPPIEGYRRLRRRWTRR
jgi:hypothetical protein